MFAEEYGIVIKLMEGSNTSQYHTLPFAYTAQEAVENDTILALQCHGETLADIAAIWETPETIADRKSYIFKLDGAGPLIKGYENRPFKELTVRDQTNLIPILLEWAAEQALKAEMPKLAKALTDLCL
jgi:hypothetical protein